MRLYEQGKRAHAFYSSSCHWLPPSGGGHERTPLFPDVENPVTERETGAPAIRGRAREDRTTLRNDVKLGEHFTSSINTGIFCAYLPQLEQKRPWQT